MNEEDKILSEINERGFVSFTKDNSEESVKAKNRLLGYELIQKKGDYSYNFTPQGLEAFELGGFNTWLTQKQNTENQDSEIRELTIKQLKGNIFQLKYWWLLLLISGLIGFITGNFKLILKWFE
jgi:hypothetical protein